MEVTPPPFNPKEGIQRMQEFERTLREEEEKEQAENPRNQEDELPQRKKRKQQNVKKNESTEQVLKRQYKAAKNIASTCRWVLSQVYNAGRISVTSSEEFEASHFTDYCITKREEQWLKEHSTAEKVLVEVVTAYENAPKWEPFPRENLSPEDQAVLESKQAAYLKELEETRRISEILLSRTGDSASAEQHLIEYGAQNTGWIQERYARNKTNKPTDTANIATQKCDVIECELEAVEGTCGSSICSSTLRFCEIHLHHNSHSMHRVREINITAQLSVKISFIIRLFIKLYFHVNVCYSIQRGKVWA